MNLKVSAESGLVFQLTPEVEKLYSKFFDITECNGANAKKIELPLAATYIIDREGKIIWSFLDAGYAKRAEPREILEILDELE